MTTPTQQPEQGPESLNPTFLQEGRPGAEREPAIEVDALKEAFEGNKQYEPYINASVRFVELLPATDEAQTVKNRIEKALEAAEQDAKKAKNGESWEKLENSLLFGDEAVVEQKRYDKEDQVNDKAGALVQKYGAEIPDLKQQLKRTQTEISQFYAKEPPTDLDLVRRRAVESVRRIVPNATEEELGAIAAKVTLDIARTGQEQSMKAKSRCYDQLHQVRSEVIDNAYLLEQSPTREPVGLDIASNGVAQIESRLEGGEADLLNGLRNLRGRVCWGQLTGNSDKDPLVSDLTSATDSRQVIAALMTRLETQDHTLGQTTVLAQLINRYTPTYFDTQELYRLGGEADFAVSNVDPQFFEAVYGKGTNISELRAVFGQEVMQNADPNAIQELPFIDALRRVHQVSMAIREQIGYVQFEPFPTVDAAETSPYMPTMEEPAVVEAAEPVVETTSPGAPLPTEEPRPVSTPDIVSTGELGKAPFEEAVPVTEVTEEIAPAPQPEAPVILNATPETVMNEIDIETVRERMERLWEDLPILDEIKSLEKSYWSPGKAEAASAIFKSELLTPDYSSMVESDPNVPDGMRKTHDLYYGFKKRVSELFESAVWEAISDIDESLDLYPPGQEGELLNTLSQQISQEITSIQQEESARLEQVYTTVRQSEAQTGDFVDIYETATRKLSYSYDEMVGTIDTLDSYLKNLELDNSVTDQIKKTLESDNPNVTGSISLQALENSLEKVTLKPENNTDVVRTLIDRIQTAIQEYAAQVENVEQTIRSNRYRSDAVDHISSRLVRYEQELTQAELPQARTLPITENLLHATVDKLAVAAKDRILIPTIQQKNQLRTRVQKLEEIRSQLNGDINRTMPELGVVMQYLAQQTTAIVERYLNPPANQRLLQQIADLRTIRASGEIT